jgi:hypothetical protein
VCDDALVVVEALPDLYIQKELIGSVQAKKTMPATFRLTIGNS